MNFSNKTYIILFIVILIIIILLIQYLYKNIERKLLLESFTTALSQKKEININSRKKDPIESVPLVFKNDGLIVNADKV